MKQWDFDGGFDAAEHLLIAGSLADVSRFLEIQAENWPLDLAQPQDTSSRTVLALTEAP